MGDMKKDCKIPPTHPPTKMGNRAVVVEDDEEEEEEAPASAAFDQRLP